MAPAIKGPEKPICVRFTNLTCTRLLFGSLSSRHAHEIKDTLGHQRDAPAPAPAPAPR